MKTFVFGYKDNKISKNADYLGIHKKATIYIDAIDEIRAHTLLYTLYVKDMNKWELIDSYSYAKEA